MLLPRLADYNCFQDWLYSSGLLPASAAYNYWEIIKEQRKISSAWVRQDAVFTWWQKFETLEGVSSLDKTFILFCSDCCRSNS